MAAVAAAALSGCGVGGWFMRGEPVEVIEVARGQLCGSEAGVRVLESAQAVSDWLPTGASPRVAKYRSMANTLMPMSGEQAVT